MEWIMVSAVVVSLFASLAVVAVLGLALRDRSRLDARLIDRLADKACVGTDRQIDRIEHEAKREAMSIYRTMATPAPGVPEPVDANANGEARAF